MRLNLYISHRALSTCQGLLRHCTFSGNHYCASVVRVAREETHWPSLAISGRTMWGAKAWMEWARQRSVYRAINPRHRHSDSRLQGDTETLKCHPSDHELLTPWGIYGRRTGRGVKHYFGTCPPSPISSQSVSVCTDITCYCFSKPYSAAFRRDYFPSKVGMIAWQCVMSMGIDGESYSTYFSG